MNFIDLIEDIVKSQQLFHSQLEGNEAETRWTLIDPMILDGWGYSRKDVIVEYNLDMANRVNRYNKVDYNVLINNTPKILIEAKSLGVNLMEKYEQLEGYYNKVLSENNYKLSELIGILTDGDLYLFFTNRFSLDAMDREPFYTIRLSVSEDFERLKLLEYSKSNLVSNPVSLVVSDEEYELNTQYRIDEIDGAFSYFNSKNIPVCIDNVYIRGRLNSKIKGFRQLYRAIIKEVDKLKPDLLYYLAKQEDYQANGKIINLKFSCKPINSTNIKYTTKYGDIYISLSNTNSGYIDRILHIVQVSNFGLHNIMISLRAMPLS